MNQSSSPPGPTGSADAPSHVLLAEDDDEMRSMLAAMARQDGYLVSEASDGEELLSMALAMMDRPAGQRPDVIVSDIRMPEHDGLDVVRLLRRLGCEVPVILVTAFGDKRTHEEARAFGVQAVLDKPFDLDDLRTLLLHFAPPR